MNKKIYLILCLFLCLVSFKAEAAFSDGPVRLGVMRFISRSSGVSDDQAAAIGDIFARTLTNSKTITVLERDQLDVIASEHKLSTQGLITEETAIQIGKIAGCQYMLLGAVTKLEKVESATNIFIVENAVHNATATIDVRIVNVETTEIILSFSETGRATQKGSFINFYSLFRLVNLEGLEAAAIMDATSRLGFKVREALTGESVQVLEAGNKEITLGIGVTGGAQNGSLFRVYVDGGEIFDIDGRSLGHKMNDIAVVKIVDVQNNFSIAESAGKNAGKINLIRRGDKIYPINNEEFQSLAKRKVFPTNRPREMKLDKDLEDLLKDVKTDKKSSSSKTRTKTKKIRERD